MTTKKMLTGAGALALLLVLMLAAAGCTGTTPGGNATATPSVTTNATGSVTTVPTTYTGPRTDLLIATTTSLEDTGLLDNLTPIYEATHPVNLKITSQGTGLAIELAKRGDADSLLVHSPSQELAFMEQGYGVNRRAFAYNYFNIVGPESDPAGVKNLTPEAAFTKIRTRRHGRQHERRLRLARRQLRDPHGGEEHLDQGGVQLHQGHPELRRLVPRVRQGHGRYPHAREREGRVHPVPTRGPTSRSRATSISSPLITQGASLLNIYSAMSVIPKNNATATIEAANDYTNFLISPQGQALIADYGKEQYGKGLFNPMTPEKAKEFKVDSTTPATATRPVLIYAAGSLASPFAKLKKSFDANNTGSELASTPGPRSP